jgi:pimeloyl-ACP methyl ester carboxylesterase
VADTQRHTLRLDVADVAPEGVRELAVDVFVPAGLPARPVVLVCAPGGGMSRGYFDVEAPGEHGNYSMARHLVAAGFVVVTLDPPGVGDSDVPVDGYSLTVPAVADVYAAAVDRVLGVLRAGGLDGVPACDDLVSVGVGHSAGGMITTVQQARHRQYAALALFGFGNNGRVALGEARRRADAGAASFADALDALEALDDRDEFHARVAALAEVRFGTPLPRSSNTSTSPFLLGGMDVPPEVLDALGTVKSNLIAVVGLTSMVSGSVAPEMAAIDVPVFLGVGERDITGPAHAIPAAFTAAPEVLLYVLPAAGHNHNVAPNREDLWDRLATWVRTLDLSGPSPVDLGS